MLRYYRIAGLAVQMDTHGRTLRQAEPYQSDAETEADIIIRSYAALLKEKQPHLSEDDSEYLSTGSSFYNQLLRFDGMLLHSSAVVMDGQAYLFSAPCGTGKSTHTALWQQVFGRERAQILNDDKPALRLENGQFYAYGTPWSGKTDANLNLRVPLGGICLLRRGEVNKIEPYGGLSALHALLEQTARPMNADLMKRLLGLLDQLLRTVPIWKMECNMDPEAAQVSYSAMSGNRKG